jgi:peroxiredoxin
MLNPTTAPSDFELPDTTGTLRRLSDLVRACPIVLLFYRGYW